MELLASKEAEEEEETGFDSWEQEEASQSMVFSRQKTTPAKK